MKAKMIVVAVLGLCALSGSAWALDDMVSHWKFDEGSGVTAYDSAGTNDGTVYGATWTAGQIDGALSFNGSNNYVSVPHNPALDITGDITISVWIYLNEGALYEAIVTKCVGNGTRYDPYDFRSTLSNLTLVRADASGHERVYCNLKIPLGQWHHGLVRVENKVPDFYVDGVITGKSADVIFTRTPVGNTNPVLIGRRNDGHYFNGKIDDVRIYDRALSVQEIQQLSQKEMTKAFNPYPSPGATGMEPNVVLGWAPGMDALSHDVYFGTSYDDVNDADTLSDEYKGNYDVNSYDPGGLDFGTTYFWRIDEVVDSNIVKGNVWSFKTQNEPGIISWWKFDEGSGATAYDSAGTNDGVIYGAQWTTGQINGALDFDGVDDYVDMADTVKNYLETSYTVSVWIKTNTVSAIDAFSIIAYRHSTNGSPVLFALGQYNADINFAVRDNSLNLAQPVYTNALTTNEWYHIAGVREENVLNVYVNGVSGIPDSQAFGEISPDNLKIGAILWGGNPISAHFDGTIDDVMIFNSALSAPEIQQLYQQGRIKAFAPYPSDGAISTDPNVVLSWTPGYEALSHDVYLGTSYDDVYDADTLSDEYKGNHDVNSYDPCGLDFGTTYFWRIDEVVDSNIVKGDVWNFKTWSEPNIISWWKFDEGSGATAYDSAGSNDGTINGAAWITGKINSALSFDGVDDYVDIPYNSNLDRDASEGISLSVWFKLNTYPDSLHQGSIFGLFDSTDAGYKNHLFISKSIYGNSITWDQFPPSHGWISSIKPDSDKWYHVVAVEDSPYRAIYINGSLDSSDNLSESYQGNTPDTIRIGNRADGFASFYFDGTIDDVMIFDGALSAPQVWEIYCAGMSYKASNPRPANGSTYVDPNGVLSWAPGKDAVGHDVYLGTSYEDVNDANTTVTLGVYKGRRDVNNYDPNGLQLGQKYYWRIDEVNDSSEIWKGDVWTFITSAQYIPNLVSWWMFDEGQGSIAYDSAGNNDGTVNGATWTTGQINGALSFDGSDDYVSVPHDPMLNITGDITISTWIYLNEGALYEAIVTKCVGNGTSYNPYDFRSTLSGLTLVRADASGHERVYSNLKIPLGEWHHGLVRVENKVPDFYVDGVITGKSADVIFTRTPVGNANPVLIGKRIDGHNFNGLIDDVRIYDRALSEEEVWEVYQGSLCEPGRPCINVWPETLDFYADQGGANPQPQILSVSNFGDGILNYHITEDCSWLEIDPNSGSSDGEPNEMIVSVDISGLDCGLYECDLIVSDPNASNDPQIVNVQLEVFREDCQIDVRVAPVVVLTDPDLTSEVRTILPDSIPGVVTSGTYYIEIWASDVGATNTGLTGVYVDVDICSQTQALAVKHGTIFVTFPDGTIQTGGVNEFGGSALPSGGGIEPEWVRIGWIRMNAQTETEICTISLLPSSTGIAALNRGIIPWTAVDLGSVELQITPPARSYDLDGDDFIGLSDLSYFAASWKQHVPPADEAHDFDCDNKVGISDLSWFATGWQKYTNDPTILYPPCSKEPEAVWLLNNSAFEMQNSDNFQTSIPTGIDIAFSLAVLDSPSSSDITTILPTSVKKISAGQTYYLELWVSDRGYINTGLTSAYVDLSFSADVATATNVSYDGIFTLFHEESILSGKIDELGGSSLPGGDGIEPEWARVAVVEILAHATMPFVTFTLSPSSLGVAALGRGTIPWNDISLGTLLICPADFDNDADVDEKDIAIFSSAWHTRPGDPQWNSDCDITTPSGYIDRSDLAWVLDSWLIGIVP